MTGICVERHHFPTFSSEAIPVIEGVTGHCQAPKNEIIEKSQYVSEKSGSTIWQEWILVRAEHEVDQ
jgi:hypothetical protein